MTESSSQAWDLRIPGIESDNVTLEMGGAKIDLANRLGPQAR